MTQSLYSREYIKFRQLLRKAREEAKITQAELGARLNKPQSYIYKNESGERRVDIIEFFEIMDALNKNPYDIFEEITKMYKWGKAWSKKVK